MNLQFHNSMHTYVSKPNVMCKSHLDVGDSFQFQVRSLMSKTLGLNHHLCLWLCRRYKHCHNFHFSCSEYWICAGLIHNIGQKCGHKQRFVHRQYHRPRRSLCQGAGSSLPSLSTLVALRDKRLGIQVSAGSRPPSVVSCQQSQASREYLAPCFFDRS